MAIDTAMLGGLGAAFSGADAAERSVCAWVFTIAAVFALGAALFCAAIMQAKRGQLDDFGNNLHSLNSNTISAAVIAGLNRYP